MKTRVLLVVPLYYQKYHWVTMAEKAGKSPMSEQTTAEEIPWRTSESVVRKSLKLRDGSYSQISSILNPTLRP